MKGRILFKEEQGFVGTFSWYLMIIVSVLSIVPLVVLLSMNKLPLADGMAGLAVLIGVMGLILALLLVSRLYVSIDASAIYYRFPPFVAKEKTLSMQDIATMEVRKVRPLWEYGGYGYRVRLRSGTGLIVAGSYGLQLTLQNGKRLLIGTQKPEELKRALEKMHEHEPKAESHA